MTLMILYSMIHPADPTAKEFASVEKSIQSLAETATEEKNNTKFSEYAELLNIFKTSNQGLKTEEDGKIRSRSQSTSAITNFFSTDRSKTTQKALSTIFSPIHEAIQDRQEFYVI